MTDTTPAVRAAHAWVAMWNREVPADEVVAPDVVVRFGATPLSQEDAAMVGAGALQAEVDLVAERVPGVRYSLPTPPLESGGGVVTLLWNVAAGGGTRTGIDILVLDGERVRDVRSITGALELPPL